MVMEVLFGVTGGIAAYKSAIIVSQLRQRGCAVRVVMTQSATELVAPKTFEALSGQPVATEIFDHDECHTHIELARSADVFCVAPATANILGKAANGIADDLLSTLLLSFDGPLIMAPAMNTAMWRKAVVQRNIQQLQADGVILIGPETGHLSCGEEGMGRMADPTVIMEAILNLKPSLPSR